MGAFNLSLQMSRRIRWSGVDSDGCAQLDAARARLLFVDVDRRDVEAMALAYCTAICQAADAESPPQSPGLASVAFQPVP